MAKIDRLFLTKHPKVFRKPGHRVSILIDGYDSPEDYSVECSCGWDGRSFSTFVSNWRWLLAVRQLMETPPRAERAAPFQPEIYEAYQNLHSYSSFRYYGSKAPPSDEGSRKLEELQVEWRNLLEKLKG